MTKEFDLRELFNATWGYAPPLPIPVIPEGDRDQQQPVIPTIEQAPERKMVSRLGQPFYAEDAMGREFFLPVHLDGMLIPFAVISMNWKKVIVKTPMPERGGSVLEMVSVDNYSFNVKGIFINESEFPESDIIALHDKFTKNQSIVMRSALTDIVLSGVASDPDGHRVVIEDINWPAVSGVEHARPFELKMVSDTIFDLEVPADLIGPVPTQI